jgi:hypothetical protein
MKKLVCRYVYSLFLIHFAFFVTEVFAQQPASSSGAPDITVISKAWRSKRATRRHPRAKTDPPKVNLLENEIKDIQQNKERAEKGLPLERTANLPTPNYGVGTAKYNLYIYEATMKNTGNKKIRSVTWDYVFFEPETKRELGRRKFVSKVNIRPDEEKKITEYSESPPAYIVGAAVVVNDPSDQYVDELIIRSIEYADGSVWKP